MSLSSLMQYLKTPIREIVLIPPKNHFTDLYTEMFHEFACKEFKVSEDALFLSRSEHPMLVIVEKPYAFTVNHLSIDYIEFSQEGADSTHGINSWKKVDKLNLVKINDKDDKLTTKFIIENHYIDDTRAKRDLSDTPIHDKECAWKLYSLFCYAYSLDHVRIGDLVVQELRLVEIPKLLMFAQSCLLYIRQ